MAAKDASTGSKKQQTARKRKYQRARIRHLLLTLGPDKLTGGRLSRRHIAAGVVVKEYEVTSPLWPSAFDGLRIAHVSDFHVGELMNIDRAIDILKRVGAEKPDLVACTGDVVDLHYHDAPPVLDAMAKLDAPLGSFLVLGNHDELHCPETIATMARSAGVKILRNEMNAAMSNGASLRIAGIEWAKTAGGCATYVRQTCSEPVDLLLAHNPKAFDAAADSKIALTLSGHTHGGTVAMKKRPNVNLALAHRRSAGLFSKGDSRMYVTTGVGAWLPVRINCPAEIAMIVMKRG
jgi:predicted MPP superfamily phosphohydrolase